MQSLIKEKYNFKSFLTSTDPECTALTGGLATLCNNKFKMIKINPVTDAFKNIQYNGRVQLT
eukprot:11244796-Karenia_brevis.AAC.1